MAQLRLIEGGEAKKIDAFMLPSSGRKLAILQNTVGKFDH